MFPRVGDSLKAPLSTVVHQFDTEYLETVIFLLIRCALWRSCWLASGNFIKLQVAWVTWLIITFGEDYNPIQFWGQYVLGMGVQMGMMCYSTRYSSYKQVSLIQVQGLAIQIPQWFVIKPCPQPKAWYSMSKRVISLTSEQWCAGNPQRFRNPNIPPKLFPLVMWM